MNMSQIKHMLTEGINKFLIKEDLEDELKQFSKDLARKISLDDGRNEDELISMIQDKIVSSLPSDLPPDAKLSDVIGDDFQLDEPENNDSEVTEPNFDNPVDNEPEIQEPETGEIPGQDPEGTPVVKDKAEINRQKSIEKYGIENIQPTIQNIEELIDDNFRARILYQGEKENKPSWRFVDIYNVGGSPKAGNTLIRAYQAFGYTTTAIPKWKLFRLDRILQMQKTGFNYGNKPISDYSASIPDFKPNHDKSMVGQPKIKQFKK